MRRIILVTGAPGVGKTTMINRLCTHFARRGLRIEGIVTDEVRKDSSRIGFKITDIGNGGEGWLARKDSLTGPKVGSYRVVTEDLQRIGVRALERAISGNAGLVVVDEIGPMEMTSLNFRNAVIQLLRSDKSAVVTFKLGSQYSEIDEVRPNSERVEMTKENREEIFQRIVKKIDEWEIHSGA